MGKNSKDWKEALTLGTYGWDSRDWGQAAMVVGGAAAGALTGGLSLGWTAAAVGAGAGIGGILGLGQGYEDQIAEETEKKQEKAIAKQEADARQNEILRKQSLLAANQTMTAREAMARNINAAIKKMYSPKTASNNPTPYMLGGEKEVLG